jgi:hypothetical protein
VLWLVLPAISAFLQIFAVHPDGCLIALCILRAIAGLRCACGARACITSVQ